MFVENQSLVWNDLNLGTELTLIHDDGTIEVKNSLWKRFDLNGFRGWLLLPQEAYKNFVPDDDNFYNLIFKFASLLSYFFFIFKSNCSCNRIFLPTPSS